MEEKRKVVINLDDSTYARSFALENIVHRREYDRVRQLLDKQLSGINGYEQTKRDIESSEPYTYYNSNSVISILGGRGSGKTSFLRSVLKEFKSSYTDVKVLSIIDPTMLDESAHVLVLLVSIIDDEVKKALEGSEMDIHSKSFENKRRWLNELKKISSGLAMLDNLGNGFKRDVNWQDDEYVMKKGLVAVSSSFYLGKNFHSLVDTALGILGKKAFLLAFDDVDVDMSKGWKVLESIRKYITTPKILCLISGNIKLYSTNVRIRQWEQLKQMMNYEKDSNLLKNQVNELEGQYLLKILKVENRVHLDSLQEASRTTDYYVKASSDEEMPLKNRYVEILNNSLGIREPGIVRHFTDYLLSLSLRSQINLLRSRIIESGVGVSSVEVFLSRMLANNIPVDMAAQNPGMLVPIISNFLIGQNLLKESYLLIPASRDSSINACLVGLAILLAKQIPSNPFLILDYMLRIAYTRNIASYMTTSLRANDMSEYANLGREGNSKNMVGLLMAYEEGHKISNMSEHIRLYALNVKSRSGQSNRIDTVLGKTNAACKALGMLPLCALKKSSNNSSSIYYSVFLLLATICQILKAPLDKESVLRVIKDAQLYRYYPVPTLEGDNLDTTYSKDDIFADTAESSDSSFSNLVEEVLSWKQLFQDKGLILPPHVIGRIMTRFYSSVKNIRKGRLGEQMSMSVISFLNACLIEEARENITTGDDDLTIEDINFNNVVTSDSIYFDNIAKFSSSSADKYIGFTKLMMSCPLIHPYIKFSNFKEGSKDVYSSIVNRKILDWNLVGILNDVTINYQDDLSDNKFYYGKNNWMTTLKLLEQNYHNLEELFRNNDDQTLAKKLIDSQLFSGGVSTKTVSLFRKKYMLKYFK